MTKAEFQALPFPETTEDVIAILMKFRYRTKPEHTCFLSLQYNREKDNYKVCYLNAEKIAIQALQYIDTNPERALWKMYQKLYDLYAKY